MVWRTRDVAIKLVGLISPIQRYAADYAELSNANLRLAHDDGGEAAGNENAGEIARVDRGAEVAVVVHAHGRVQLQSATVGTDQAGASDAFQYIFLRSFMPCRHTSTMNYRRLEYFLAVVDGGTVTAAAEELRIAQPALSRQLRTLEREIKLPLFETHGNRLVLTRAGHAFVPMARRLMQETRAAEEAVTALRTGEVPSLTVAATAASIRGFLAPFIATTSPQDPLLMPRETTHFGIYDTLLHGADFVVSPAPQKPDLESLDLGSIPLKAYVPPHHEWAQQERREITLKELCEAQLILPSHASVSRYVLDDALNQQRLSPAGIHECDDGLSIQALAAAGHGVGITTDLPHYGVHPILVRTKPAREADSLREALLLPLHAAWLPNHYAAEVIRRLTERLREFLDAQGATRPSDPPRSQ